MNSVSLYCREGASDKEYHARIAQQNGGYVVLFSYGRRGTSLQSGTKTQQPVGLDEAQRILDRLAKEKLGKGYKPGEDGSPYVGAETPKTTGIACQLLNPIDKDEVSVLLVDNQFCMQEKADGRRLLIKRRDGVTTGINRKGMSVAIAEPIEKSVRTLGTGFILDGEAIGDTYIVFDILEYGGEDIRSTPYEHRWKILRGLIGKQPAIELVKTALGSPAKVVLFEQLNRGEREGVVFKDLSAPYTAGRPCAGGTQLKHKFYATASAVVGKVNTKRSVSLRLLKGQEWVDAGNVTIPANQSVPDKGSIVEIRYLYAFPESGRFYQPTYLGQRDDITADACTVAQLKFKSTDSEEDEEAS